MGWNSTSDPRPTNPNTRITTRQQLAPPIQIHRRDFLYLDIITSLRTNNIFADHRIDEQRVNVTNCNYNYTK